MENTFAPEYVFDRDRIRNKLFSEFLCGKSQLHRLREGLDFTIFENIPGNLSQEPNICDQVFFHC
jgi:hypothetical protein